MVKAADGDALEVKHTRDFGRGLLAHPSTKKNWEMISQPGGTSYFPCLFLYFFLKALFFKCV